MKIEGFETECQAYFANLNIDCDFAVSLTKQQYRHLIRRKMKEKNISDILERSKSYKMINFVEMKDETFPMKDYLKT